MSTAVVVTARVGTRRFHVRLTAGRRTVRLPLWLVAARARGVRLVATDPYGATAGVTLPRRPA